jgi:protein SCO1/2
MGRVRPIAAAAAPAPPLRRRLVAAAALAPLAVGCEPARPQFASIDITGASYARDIDAVDAAGRPRRLADYRGKVVVVFFGFAQCPDVCPTALARQAQVMQLLGREADRVQVLFITLDPERDSDALLQAYAAGFDARFAGWRFDPATVAQLAREFKVYYAKVPLQDSSLGYTIDHSAVTYVFDPQGRIRLAVKHEQSADSIATDLRQLLSGK